MFIKSRYPSIDVSGVLKSCAILVIISFLDFSFFRSLSIRDLNSFAILLILAAISENSLSPFTATLVFKSPADIFFIAWSISSIYINDFLCNPQNVAVNTPIPKITKTSMTTKSLPLPLTKRVSFSWFIICNPEKIEILLTTKVSTKIETTRLKRIFTMTLV